VVHCSLPMPLNRARYEVLSTAQLHFGEGGLPKLRILVPVHLMDVPLATANAALLAQAEARLLLLRPGSDGPQDRVAWLRQMVRNTRAHQPTQAELADVLGVSVSTLSRQLAAQGLSFRALANAVRHEQACELLTAGQLSVQDIALQLGYAEPANFVRAFRSLAGTSPGAYARQCRAQASQG
jgi:AraC-like DNA-binding protein